MVGPKPKPSVHAGQAILQTRLRYIDWVADIPKPRTLVLATDATGLRRFDSTSGIGFIYNNGLFGLAANPNPVDIVGPSRIMIGELRAVWYALRALDQRGLTLKPRARLTILCDSTQAIAYMNNWRNGQLVYPAGYNTTARHNHRPPSLVSLAERFRKNPRQLLPDWTPGHPVDQPGHPLNQAAHNLARLAYGLQQQHVTLEQAINQAQTLARRTLGRPKSRPNPRRAT